MKLTSRLLLPLVMMLAMVQGVYGMSDKPVEAADTLTAAGVFANLPADVLDLLPRTTRLDMLDYQRYRPDSLYKATNAMEGVSWLKRVTPSFLEVQLTDVSTMQIKLLPLKKGGSVVMTLYTIGGDGRSADTEVRFYDASLSRLRTDRYFPTPKIDDFFEIPRGSVTTMKEIEGMMPFVTMELSASPDSDDVRGMLTVEKFVNADDYNIMKVFMKPDGVLFRWDGRRFRADGKKR